MLTLQEITKYYFQSNVKISALCDISLEIGEGDFLVIMGPSGSGKSTLLNIIACLDRPTHGRYFINNNELTALSDNVLTKIRNQLFGFIFQSFNLLPRTTCLKNVELPLFYAGIGKKQRQIIAENSLKQVGLIHRINHRPNELSGGEKQRVAIARALVNKPKILIADEPTGNLDSKTSLEILNIFKELNKQGITIILVTHDSNIASFGKKIIRIKDGHIEK